MSPLILVVLLWISGLGIYNIGPLFPTHTQERATVSINLSARFPNKDRLTSSRPDALLVVPLKRAQRSNPRYELKSTGGRGGNREDSAPATATPPTFKARDPSQLHPDQRHIHLVEVKYCEDTRPNSQLQASKQQHRDLSHHLSKGSQCEPRLTRGLIIYLLQMVPATPIKIMCKK